MISINLRDPRPIYEQVRDNFRILMLSGVLPPDYKMPSVRELATSLAINPNTIHRAYRELESEGYICSVPGKGSFVCDMSEAAAARKKELLGKLSELVKELRMLNAGDEEILAVLKGDENK